MIRNIKLKKTVRSTTEKGTKLNVHLDGFERKEDVEDFIQALNEIIETMNGQQKIVDMADRISPSHGGH